MEPPTPRAWAIAPACAAVFPMLAGSCAAPDGGQPHPTPQAEPPAGLIAAPDAPIDAKTGLPRRVIHEASGIALVLIPAGDFWMGSPEAEPARSRKEQRHRRVIRRPFYMGETEVTAAQFRRFVEQTAYATDAERGTFVGGHTVGSFAAVADGERDWSEVASWRNPYPLLKGGESLKHDDQPVLHVSWNDARAFCEHFRLRLPKEAEWEYACRAGGEDTFFWGPDAPGGAGYANVRDESAKRRFASTNLWFPFDDGAEATAKVGSYRPNAWGLYDIVGNVAEWVQDDFGGYPPDGSDESVPPPDVAGPDPGHSVRGGSWVDHPDHARSAARPAMTAAARRDFIGFRVAADAIAETSRSIR